jgi:hypothetical protein
MGKEEMAEAMTISHNESFILLNPAQYYGIGRFVFLVLHSAFLSTTSMSMSMGWTIQDGYGFDLSTAYMEWMGVACVYSNGSLMFPPRPRVFCFASGYWRGRRDPRGCVLSFSGVVV